MAVAPRRWIRQGSERAAALVAGADSLPLLILSLSWSAVVVMAALLVALGDGVVREPEESRLFIYAGPVALLLGTPLALVTRAAVLGWAAAPAVGDAALLICHGVWWLGCIWVLRLASWHLGPAVPARTLISAALVAFVLGHLVALLLERRWRAASRTRGVLRGVYAALPVLGILGALPFLCGGLPPDLALPAIVAAVAIPVALRYVQPTLGRTLPWLTDGLVALALVALVVNSGLPSDRFHHNFFLGPANDLLAGKVLLVDVFSQYGVLPIAILAGVLGWGPLPMSYQGLSLVVSFLLVAQYGSISDLWTLCVGHNP